MDALDRLEAERERRLEAQALHCSSPHATRADKSKSRTDMPASAYPVTIIGCIRGVDGWYQAGWDERKRKITPLGRTP